MSDEMDLEEGNPGNVKRVNSLREPEMDDGLKALVSNMNPKQKKYAEGRAKGLNQTDAAKYAGSTASEASLPRVGFQYEHHTPGMKDYIEFLKQKRVKASVLDEIEIIEALRMVVEKGFENNNLSAVNKALELMGMMCGSFKVSTKDIKTPKNPNAQTNVDAFKPEGEVISREEKMKSITTLLNAVKKTDLYPKE